MGLATSLPHQDAGSVPTPAEWVENPVLSQLWYRLQPWLGSDPWPRNPYVMGGGGQKINENKWKRKCFILSLMEVLLNWFDYLGMFSREWQGGTASDYSVLELQLYPKSSDFSATWLQLSCPSHHSFLTSPCCHFPREQLELFFQSLSWIMSLPTQNSTIIP